MYGDRVQVALVHRPGHLQLRTQPHGHPVQVLPVQLGDRGLPRHVEAERDVVALTGLQPERARHPLTVELLVGVVLVVAALHLDAGEQPERHVLDVDLVVAAHHLDPALELAARTAVRVGQPGFHRRAADAHRLHQPLEDHNILRRLYRAGHAGRSLAP